MTRLPRIITTRFKLRKWYFEHSLLYTLIFALITGNLLHFYADISFFVIAEYVFKVAVNIFTILLAIVGIIEIVFRGTFKRLRGTNVTREYFNHLFTTIAAFGVLMFFIVVSKYISDVYGIKNIILFVSTVFCFTQGIMTVYMLKELVYREHVRVEHKED